MPGTGWSYSNANYVLSGDRRVTGRRPQQLRQDRDPLNLHNTYFVPYEPAPEALVSGFDRDLAHIPGLLEIGANDTAWATAAYTSGAFVSTAEDLGAFYDQLFAGALLSPPMMEEMTTFVDAPNPGFAEQIGYGLGLMRLEVDGQELIGSWEFMGRPHSRCIRRRA
jgi:D-alanyl-D-alanine carboxypeptidase